MDISLSGFLFQDYKGNHTFNAVSFSKFCDIAQKAGYDGVELRRTQVNTNSEKQERKEKLAIVKNHGLYVTCLTVRGLPGKDEIESRNDYFQSYLELCNDMECSLLKIGAETSWLKEAAARAEAYGVTLATNNHVGGRLETGVFTNSGIWFCMRKLKVDT